MPRFNPSRAPIGRQPSHNCSHLWQSGTRGRSHNALLMIALCSGPLIGLSGSQILFDVPGRPKNDKIEPAFHHCLPYAPFKSLQTCCSKIRSASALFSLLVTHWGYVQSVISLVTFDGSNLRSIRKRTAFIFFAACRDVGNSEPRHHFFCPSKVFASRQPFLRARRSAHLYNSRCNGVLAPPSRDRL